MRKKRTPKAARSVVVTLRLPPDVVEKARRRAEAEDRSLSYVLAQFIKGGLES